MRRTVMFLITALTTAGLALPATAAPPPGFPPSSPPGQDGGDRPAPPRGNPGTPAEISIGDVTVPEGETAIMTITASSAPTQDVAVDWATADGTATVADGDYPAASGTATIAKGATSTTIQVATSQDTVDDDGETFLVVLSAVSDAATIADGSATVSITDDDDPPSDLLEVAAQDLTVDEQGNAFVRLLASSQDHAEPITVTWETRDGTAIAGDDYTGDSGTATINANATAATVGIGLVSDFDLEPDETFELVLTGVTSGNAVLAEDSTGTITIVEGFCNTELGFPHVPDSLFTQLDKVCANTGDTWHVNADPGSAIPTGETIRADLRSDGWASLHLALAVPGGEAVVATPLMDGDTQVGWTAQLTLTEPAPEVLVEVVNEAGTDALYRLDVFTGAFAP